MNPTLTLFLGAFLLGLLAGALLFRGLMLLEVDKLHHRALQTDNQTLAWVVVWMRKILRD